MKRDMDVIFIGESSSRCSRMFICIWKEAEVNLMIHLLQPSQMQVNHVITNPYLRPHIKIWPKRHTVA